MYLEHFGFKEYPFKLTPNTNFYVSLESHSEAFSVLETALDMGEGFIKVTGEVGTGKTLLCRRLLNSLNESFIAAYIPDPCLTPGELRRALACELDLPNYDTIDAELLMSALQKYLVELAKQGKSVVLIVDEAQALPFESLEALRLLTNLETEQKKLMQVVLLGQTELDERLQSEQLRQLRQRITFSYKLRPLNREEVVRYVNHRVITAGFNESHGLFDEQLLTMLTEASRGIPRLVNVLCHKALMLGYGQGVKTLSQEHVIAAVNDTEDAYFLEPSKSFSPMMMMAAMFSGGITVGVIVVWLMGGLG